MIRPFLTALMLAVLLVAVWAAIANAGPLPPMAVHAAHAEPAAGVPRTTPAERPGTPETARSPGGWIAVGVGMGWG